METAYFFQLCVWPIRIANLAETEISVGDIAGCADVVSNATAIGLSIAMDHFSLDFTRIMDA